MDARRPAWRGLGSGGAGAGGGGGLRSSLPAQKRDTARRARGGRGALIPIGLSGVGVAALSARMHHV